MKQIQINMPKQVKFVIDTLNQNGYKSYLVGGAVRNSILSLPVKDWDICTSAKPQEIEEVF